MKTTEQNKTMNATTNNKHEVLQPYLFFDGRCEEAVEFYRKTLGAEVEALTRFKDSPDPSMCAPGAGVRSSCGRTDHQRPARVSRSPARHRRPGSPN